MAPHAAPHHVGGEAAAVERRREVVEQHDALDALVGRVQDVAEGEHAGIIDQHVHVDALRTRALEELLRRLTARQVDGERAHLHAGMVRADLRGRTFEPLRREPRHEDVVSEPREPRGIAASDAASGTRHEGPAAAAFDRSASHVRGVSPVLR